VVTREQLEFAGRQVREILNRDELRPSSLEERVQRLEDHDAIRDLIGRYALCIDAHAWEHLFEVFTEDVERILLAQGHVVLGKDNLRKIMTSGTVPIPGSHRETPDEGLAENKHMVTVEAIRVLSGRSVAYAACVYQLAMATEEGGRWARGLHEGRYILEFRRESEVWKIRKLEILSNIATNSAVTASPSR
jgi:hypothetical protein